MLHTNDPAHKPERIHLMHKRINEFSKLMKTRGKKSLWHYIKWKPQVWLNWRLQKIKVDNIIKLLRIKQEKTLRGGLSGANASATNWGPRAEPPIPTDRICVKRPAGDDGGLICLNRKNVNTLNKMKFWMKTKFLSEAYKVWKCCSHRSINVICKIITKRLLTFQDHHR